MSDAGLEVDDDDLDSDGGSTGEPDADRAVGSLAYDVLAYLAAAIVDDPDSVVVEVDEGRGSVSLRLNVSPDDMGRVIGRRGRTAQAIRTVVRAAAARQGVEAHVDIVD